MTGTKPQYRQRIDHGLDELEKLRGEIKLKLHLAEMDAQSTWRRLEPKLDELESTVERQGNAVAETTANLTEDLIKSFRQLRDKIASHHAPH
jgi:hypothetical protein